MDQLKLPHRLVLLYHLNPGNVSLITMNDFREIITLAILAEAYLMGKISFENENVKIANDQKTGHSMIDDIISEISGHNQPKDPAAWSEELAERFHSYEHVKNNLMDNNILVIQKKRILGFPYKSIIAPKSKDMASIVENFFTKTAQKSNLNLRDFLTLLIVDKTKMKDSVKNSSISSDLYERLISKPAFNTFRRAIDDLQDVNK